MDRERDQRLDRTRFRDLSEIAKLINSGSDVATVLWRLARGVCQHADWSMSGIQALDMARRASIPILRYDPYSDRDAPFPTGWDASTSPIEKVLAERAPLIIADAAAQDLFPGYRDDARRRRYSTVVIVPLDALDEEARPIVLSVMARERVEPDASEIDFLRCVADLTAIALQKLKRLEQEAAAARHLRETTESLTDVMGQALSRNREATLPASLSRLMPGPWLAIDLTTGRLIYDSAALPPPLTEATGDLASALLVEARGARETGFAEPRGLALGGSILVATVEPLIIDGILAGAVFLFQEATLAEREQLAAEAGRLALSSHLLRDFVAFQTRALSAEPLMRCLLEGEWRDAEELQAAARILDFNLQPPLRLLLVTLPQEVAASDHLHRACQRLAQRTFEACLSCPTEAGVALLLPASEALERESARAAFLDRISALLPERPLLTLSPVIEQLTEIAGTWHLCVRRAKVARALGRDGWVTDKRLGAFAALMASLESAALDGFLSETLGPLAADDRQRGKSNLETVEAFLRSGGRFQATADHLGIHVSTLRYRLERIAARFDIDFEDGDALFDLEVALRINRLRLSYDS
ncbi:MAG: helix-turn-helix domain-containing protein [Rhodospirillales bacterium]